MLFKEVDPNLVIIDCRYYLTDPKLGSEEYRMQHIPSAIFADLDTNLSGSILVDTGRHPLPKLDIFTKWLQLNSISKRNQIVIYDQLGGGIAARLWFMLVQIGYEAVSVLEGGIFDWKRRNYQLNSGIEVRDPLSSEGILDIPNRWEDGVYKIYSKSEVKGLIHTKFNLIDSRSTERYLGKEEPIDPVAGHIPSAKNVNWQSHLNENLMLKSLSEIRNNILNEINLDNKTGFYCGSGVTAAFNVLMMKHLELPNPGIYIGSWSEWIKK